MNTISNYSNGIFTVTGDKVVVDFLYDGGWFKGELAIFNLEGMEELEVGSTEFIQEAANRALSNSESGYVVVKDQTDRARYSDLENELDWEGQYNGGLYNGEQNFVMNEGDTFAMMLVTNGTVLDLAADPESEEALFSFATSEMPNGETLAQIADVTGNGDTFSWEDVDINNFDKVDRDYNDFVVQVLGATAEAPSIEDSIYIDRDWLDTEVGGDLITYAARPQFDAGTFTVNSTGQVEFDYLYDGGYFSEGEVGIFRLKDLDIYEAGSEAFVAEVLDRVTSNSTEGYIVAKDAEEGARYSESLAWERDYNTDSESYRGPQTFLMNPGEHFGMVIIPGSSFEEAKTAPDWANKKQPLFSMAEANLNDHEQMAGIVTGEAGTIVGFEDVRVDFSSKS